MLFHSLVLFVKRGPRVEAEAAALEAGRHAGVVQLVEVADGTLRTRLVDGACPVAGAGPFTADEVAGVLASVATTLADLHGAGVVHGGIDGSHVLLHPEGRTVLCSLGRGGSPADDVAALGRLVAELLAAAPPPPEAPPRPAPGRRRRWRRGGAGTVPTVLSSPVAPVLAELAEAATAGDPAARPTARDLAAAVHQRVATARVPLPPGREPLLARPPGGRPPPASSKERRGVAWVGAGLSALALLALLAVVSKGLAAPGAATPRSRPPAIRSTTTVATATTGPPAVRVWPADPLDFEDGVLTVDGARYAVGQAGDAVVAGDWACTGRRTVALLRPPTGEVFAFDTWAEHEEVAGRLVGTVEGATGLRVIKGDDGCDDLEVARPHRDPVVVDASRAAAPGPGR